MAAVTLGAEYDRRITKATRWALRKVGAKRRGSWWGLAGSQDVTREEWRIKDEVVVLEAETYMGLTLSGQDHLVAMIASLVRERIAR